MGVFGKAFLRNGPQLWNLLLLAGCLTVSQTPNLAAFEIWYKTDLKKKNQKNPASN
jgi:hypothetical protein